jgi:hypothetical protein
MHLSIQKERALFYPDIKELFAKYNSEWIKVNWSKFDYKSAEGMLLAALEHYTKEKREESATVIMKWWIDWWSDKKDVMTDKTYEECKAAIKEFKEWDTKVLLNAIHEFFMVVDLNLIEFLNMSISEFVSDDKREQYVFHALC